MIDVLTAILYVKVDKVKRRAGTKLGRDYSANAGLNINLFDTYSTNNTGLPAPCIFLDTPHT